MSKPLLPDLDPRLPLPLLPGPLDHFLLLHRLVTLANLSLSRSHVNLVNQISMQQFEHQRQASFAASLV